MEALTLDNVFLGLMLLVAVYGVGWCVWFAFTEIVPEMVEEVKESLVQVWKSPRKEKAQLLAISCVPLLFILTWLRSCVAGSLW